MVAVVGIGNSIAGDDGAGIHVVRELRNRAGAAESDLLFLELEGDLLGLADHLDRAERFVFVDAAVGETPGEIFRMDRDAQVLAPSLHQADVVTVMRSFEALRLVDPFPPWELWGITVSTPLTLGEGLTPPVAAAAEVLCQSLFETLGHDAP